MMKENIQTLRSSIRLKIRDRVSAFVSIASVFGQHVESGQTPILLEDLSPSGLKLLTHLRFPVSGDYLIEVRIAFNNWEFCLKGHMRWRRREENLYAYGMSLVPDSGVAHALSAALQDQLRRMGPNRQRIHQLYKHIMDSSLKPASGGMNRRL